MSSLRRYTRFSLAALVVAGALVLGLASANRASAQGRPGVDVTPTPPRPTARSPFDEPVDTGSTGGGGDTTSTTSTSTGTAVGANGGSSVCDRWVVTVPAGSVPDGSYIHCTPYDVNEAPAAPAGLTRLNQTISFGIERNGAWITTPAKPLTVCYTPQAADLTAAGNSVNRIQVAQTTYAGPWSLPTRLSSSTLACASVSSLVGNIFEVVVGPATSNYVVKSGDSLIKIARAFGTTADALRALNNLKTDVLQIGQTLIIQGSGSTSTSTGTTSAASGSTYVVKPGDNLSRIARNLGVSLDALIAKNNITNTVIQPGQVLVVP